jgi:hypothetical protein
MEQTNSDIIERIILHYILLLTLDVCLFLFEVNYSSLH